MLGILPSSTISQIALSTVGFALLTWQVSWLPAQHHSCPFPFFLRLLSACENSGFTGHCKNARASAGQFPGYSGGTAEALHFHSLLPSLGGTK